MEQCAIGGFGYSSPHYPPSTFSCVAQSLYGSQHSRLETASFPVFAICVLPLKHSKQGFDANEGPGDPNIWQVDW